MAKGSKLTGALARPPKEKVGERLSAGVYRGDKGSLVNKSGRVIPRGQPSNPQMPPPSAYNNLPGYRGMEGQMNSNPWEGIMGKGPAMDPGYNQGGIGAPNEAANLAGMYAANPNDIQSGMLQVPGGRPLPTAIANMIAGQRPQYDSSLNQGPMQNYIYRYPPTPQMPQPSANNGGQYRLSPGVYGTQQQAMNQYNQQMQQMQQPFQMQGVPQQSKR